MKKISLIRNNKLLKIYELKNGKKFRKIYPSNMILASESKFCLRKNVQYIL